MLKLKTQNLSHLSESVLKILAHNRITTILEFLQEDVSKLSALTKLSLPNVLAIRNEIFMKYSAPVTSGADLYSKVVKKRSVISTGIESLDAITNGGISLTNITEICGLADSGKSQLLHQIAINCVKNEDNTVLYIDTKGDFSAVRIQKNLDAQGYSHKDMALIMSKIRVVHIWTMQELVELLKTIKNKTLVIENLTLIVVDSLPCLMFQFLGDENKIGLSLLNTLVNYSRFISNDFNVGFVYANIQTRWIDNDISEMEDDDLSALREHAYVEKRNRCLGRYWEHIPALVLLLEKLEDNSKTSDKCMQINVSVVSSTNVISRNAKCVLNVSTVGIT